MLITSDKVFFDGAKLSKMMNYFSNEMIFLAINRIPGDKIQASTGTN